MTRDITDNNSRLLSYALTLMPVTIELAVTGSNKRDGGLRIYHKDI